MDQAIIFTALPTAAILLLLPYLFDGRYRGRRLRDSTVLNTAMVLFDALFIPLVLISLMIFGCFEWAIAKKQHHRMSDVHGSAIADTHGSEHLDEGERQSRDRLVRLVSIGFEI